jgi:hypothetical protein
MCISRRVCVQVAEFASTPTAVAAARDGRLRIGHTPVESSQLLAETEAAGLCALTFEGVKDIRKVVQKAASGQSCQIAELADVGCTLEAAARLQVSPSLGSGCRPAYRVPSQYR